MTSCLVRRQTLFTVAATLKKGWLGTLGVTPWYPTASQGALDFLFVQVTIALDALLMPMNGRLYYFDLTLKRVFVLLHT